jgi:rSAM/selenodomain-associated transferase 1
MKKAIIIFQKNPELGKVKTRLAATIGDKDAMKIYMVLLEHTHKLANQIEAKKYLYFSDFIENDEKWNTYERKVQNGEDLGLRMFNAISEVKKDGFEQIVVLGTDCYELTVDIIIEAFDKLENNDYCIGPALDGGYYLIGTKKPDVDVFLGKEWSTETVFREAKQSVQDLGKKLAILEALSDVDYEDDLKTLREFLE